MPKTTQRRPRKPKLTGYRGLVIIETTSCLAVQTTHPLALTCARTGPPASHKVLPTSVRGNAFIPMVWVASSSSLCSTEQKGGDRWWPLCLWDPRRVWPASQFPAETTLGPPSVHAPKRCKRLGEGEKNFSHSWGSVSIREAESRDLQVFMWPKFREEALSEFTHSPSLWDLDRHSARSTPGSSRTSLEVRSNLPTPDLLNPLHLGLWFSRLCRFPFYFERIPPEGSWKAQIQRKRRGSFLSLSTSTLSGSQQWTRAWPRLKGGLACIQALCSFLYPGLFFFFVLFFW